MNLTNEESYYLARFLTERYTGLSMETIMSQMQIDSDLEKDSFIRTPYQHSGWTVIGELSPSFVELEHIFEIKGNAYAVNNPSRVDPEYVSLIPVEKTRSQLQYDNVWYTGDQLDLIVTELSEELQRLQSQIYDEEIQSEYLELYDLIISLMRYGLDQTESRISVDFTNPYYTWRSKMHSNGVVFEETIDELTESIGYRINKIFGEITVETKEDMMDRTVDELRPYYIGSVRRLSKVTTKTIKSHLGESERTVN